MSRTLNPFSAKPLSVSVPAAVVLCLAAGLTVTAPPGTALAQGAAGAANAARLDQLLQQWSQSSGKILKLQGKHHRFVYDKVFEEEKRAEGVFYYEGPSKGRIDLKPVNVQGQKSERIGEDGEPYQLKPDNAQRWICDGERIWQIDDALMQIDIFPLPPQLRGQNIMDGPLPFLFGMPPKKAKARYDLKLVLEGTDRRDGRPFADIVAKPKRAEDAANWSTARIRLDKLLFIPKAVQLVAPAGNLETVYTFDVTNMKVADTTGRDDLKGNIIQQILGIGNKDPFKPEIPKNYKVKVNQPTVADAQPQPQPQPQLQPNVVPQVVNMPWTDAGALLEKVGCKVEYLRGPAPPQPQLEYVVAGQEPAAGTPLKPGLLVKLTVFDKAPAGAGAGAGNGQPVGNVQPAGNPQPMGAVMPKVTGQYWQKAGEALAAIGITKEAGYTIEYLQGAAPPTEKQLYEVYEQFPQAGQPVPAGGKITLRVYNTPQTAGN